MSLTGSKSTPVNEDGLTILKATYGVDTQSVDVTTEIKGMIQDGDLNFVVSAQSLGIPDPNPGASATQILQIQYRVNGGHPKLEKFTTGAQVAISVPNVKRKKTNHSFSLMKYIWGSIVVFFVGLLVIDGYKTGNYIFGYRKESIVPGLNGDTSTTVTYENVGAGIILALITLLSFGTSWMYVLLPIALIFGFMRRQR
jgi:hypothetical protein